MTCHCGHDHATPEFDTDIKAVFDKHADASNTSTNRQLLIVDLRRVLAHHFHGSPDLFCISSNVTGEVKIVDAATRDSLLLADSGEWFV